MAYGYYIDRMLSIEDLVDDPPIANADTPEASRAFDFSPRQLVVDSSLRGYEKSVASEGRSRSAGAQEPECTLKYMRIPSTAGTRDPERSRFFHNL